MEQEALLQQDAEAHLLREAEERRFLYKDVEELIEVGFLTHTFVVEGVPVTFRSFLPPDFVRFRVRASHLRDRYSMLRWSVASAVWMLNGYEISRDPKDNGPFHVHQEWVSKLPPSLLDVFGTAIISFNTRVSRAIRLTEAFCYETYSRSLWRMRGRSAGDPETANVVRRMWSAFNTVEDDDKADERLWSHTRTVVGSLSNKGAKYITKELGKVADREKERRQRAIEEAVNWVIRGDEKRVPLTVMVGGEEIEVPHIHSAQTEADLAEEMRRVFTGEKDYHDHLVDEYQKSVKNRVVAKREARQAMIAEARRRADEAEDQGQTPLVGYTEEQLKQIRPDIKRQRTTAAIPASAQSNHMFDRYFSPTMKPGVLTPGLKVEGAETAGKRLLPPKESGPESGPELTLQEKIAKRQPKLQEP